MYWIIVFGKQTYFTFDQTNIKKRKVCNSGGFLVLYIYFVRHPKKTFCSFFKTSWIFNRHYQQTSYYFYQKIRKYSPLDSPCRSFFTFSKEYISILLGFNNKISIRLFLHKYILFHQKEICNFHQLVHVILMNFCKNNPWISIFYSKVFLMNYNSINE